MAEEAAADFKTSLEDLTFNSKPIINMLTMVAEENIEHASAISKVIEERFNKVPSNKKLPLLYLIDSIIKNIRDKRYVECFQNNLVGVFSSVFLKVDEKTRQALYKLRQTWSPIFSNKTLYALDKGVAKIDPAWPVTAKPPDAVSIHINPKFLNAQKSPSPDLGSDEEVKKKQQRALEEQRARLQAQQRAEALKRAQDEQRRAQQEQQRQQEADRQRKEQEMETLMREQLLSKQQELLRLQQERLELELAEARTRLEQQTKQLQEREQQMKEQLLLQLQQNAKRPKEEEPKPKPAPTEVKDSVPSKDPRSGKPTTSKPIAQSQTAVVHPTKVSEKEEKVASKEEKPNTRSSEKVQSPNKNKAKQSQVSQQSDRKAEDENKNSKPKKTGPALKSNRVSPDSNLMTREKETSSRRSKDLPKRKDEREKSKEPERERAGAGTRSREARNMPDRRITQGDKSKRNYRGRQRSESPEEPLKTERKRTRGYGQSRSRSRSPLSHSTRPKGNAPRRNERSSSKEPLTRYSSERSENRAAGRNQQRRKNDDRKSEDKDKKTQGIIGRREDKRRDSSPPKKKSRQEKDAMTSKKDKESVHKDGIDDDGQLTGDLAELFGKGDQDYRRLPPIPKISTNLSESGQEMVSPDVMSPRSAGWSKFKESHPEDFPFAQPRSNEAIHRQTSLCQYRSPPSDATGSMTDMLKQAEEQLLTGKLTPSQHRDLVKQIEEIQELQNIKQQLREENKMINQAKPTPEHLQNIRSSGLMRRTLLGSPPRIKFSPSHDQARFSPENIVESPRKIYPSTNEGLKPSLLGPGPPESKVGSMTRPQIKAEPQHPRFPSYSDTMQDTSSENAMPGQDLVNHSRSRRQDPRLRRSRNLQENRPLGPEDFEDEDSNQGQSPHFILPHDGKMVGEPHRSMEGSMRGLIDGPQRSPFDGPKRPLLDDPTRGPMDGPKRHLLDHPPRGPMDGPKRPLLDDPVRGPMDIPKRPLLDDPLRGPMDGPKRTLLDDPPMRQMDGPLRGPMDGLPRGPMDGPQRGPILMDESSQDNLMEIPHRSDDVPQRGSMGDVLPQGLLNEQMQRPMDGPPQGMIDMHEGPMGGPQRGSLDLGNQGPMNMQQGPMDGPSPGPRDRPPHQPQLMDGPPKGPMDGPSDFQGPVPNFEMGHPLERSESFEPLAHPWYDTDVLYCPEHDGRWVRRASARKPKDDTLFVLFGTLKLQIPFPCIERRLKLGKNKEYFLTWKYEPRQRLLFVNGKPFYRIGEDPKLLTLQGKSRYPSEYPVYIEGMPKDVWIDDVQYPMRRDAPAELISFSSRDHKFQIDTARNMVVADGHDICPADGPQKKIQLAYVVHTIQFEPPPKRILIDGNLCEIDLVARYPMVIMNDIAHGIRFDGPPREIIINDIVYTVPMDQPRKVKFLGSRPHLLAFGGPGHEVIIEDTWYEIKFGEPPKQIRIGARTFKIELPGKPPEVKILGEFVPIEQIFSRAGNPNMPLGPPMQNSMGPRQSMPGQPMMGHSMPRHPMMRPPMPRQPLSGQPMQRPSMMGQSFPGQMMPNPMMGGPMNMGGMPQGPPDIKTAPDMEPVPNIPPGMGLPMAFASSSDKNEEGISPALTMPLNVNNLLSKLVSAGMIGNSNSRPGSTQGTPPPPNESKDEIDEQMVFRESVEDIPDLTGFKATNLKKHYTGARQLLSVGIQCPSCGLRFVPEHKEQYKEHLDWHFRQNKRGKDEMKVAKHRHWYYAVSEWIEYEEIGDLEQKAQSSFFEQQKQTTTAAGQRPLPGAGEVSCPAVSGEDGDDVCDICGEAFEQFWDEDEEEWHLKEAIRANNGKTYHAVCYEDVNESNTSLLEPPSPDLYANEPPTFPASSSGEPLPAPAELQPRSPEPEGAPPTAPATEEYVPTQPAQLMDMINNPLGYLTSLSQKMKRVSSSSAVSPAHSDTPATQSTPVPIIPTTMSLPSPVVVAPTSPPAPIVVAPTSPPAPTERSPTEPSPTEPTPSSGSTPVRDELPSGGGTPLHDEPASGRGTPVEDEPRYDADTPPPDVYPLRASLVHIIQPMAGGTGVTEVKHEPQDHPPS